MWNDYRFDVWVLITGAFVTLVGGLATGEPLVVFCLVLAPYVIWHTYWTHRVRRAFKGRIEEPPRWALGPFREMFARINALKARSRKRKRRVSRYLERFREAAAALPDATVILDRDNRVVWCNPASADLLGVQWPESSGKPICELVPSPLLEDWLPDPSQSLEFRPPVNEATTLNVVIKPFGKKHERLLFARDVTEVYKVHRVRRDFIANLSHELRTPITVISGFLENLEDEPDLPEAFHKPMGHMRDQTQRMCDLVDDLLALSRLELEENSTPAVDVDITGLIDNAVAEAEVLSNHDRHRFHVSADPGIGIHGSLVELRSAVTNLIVNAVRHTPPLTDVYISWQREGSGACLEVRDSGPGIPARHIPRLTEQFYRVDSGRSRQTGGTGLGLAIVRRILDRHGAELSITSVPGRGSTFAGRFPPDIVANLKPGPSEALDEEVETEPAASAPRDRIDR